MTLRARRELVQCCGIVGEKCIACRKKVGIGRCGARGGGEYDDGGEHQTAQDRSRSSRYQHDRDYRLLSCSVDGPGPDVASASGAAADGKIHRLPAATRRKRRTRDGSTAKVRSGRCRHGQRQRLRRNAACGGAAGRIWRRVRSQGRVGSSHARRDVRVRRSAAARGLACIIAGAGGAAHLPGMLAAKTQLPILGVPIPSKHLHGKDSLFSIVQMPKGMPVATFAIGEAGASNAALFAVAMLARGDAALGEQARRLSRRADHGNVRAMRCRRGHARSDTAGFLAGAARRRSTGSHVLHGGAKHGLPRRRPGSGGRQPGGIGCRSTPARRLRRPEALRTLATLVRAATTEFENVPAASLEYSRTARAWRQQRKASLSHRTAFAKSNFLRTRVSMSHHLRY